MNKDLGKAWQLVKNGIIVLLLLISQEPLGRRVAHTIPHRQLGFPLFRWKKYSVLHTYLDSATSVEANVTQGSKSESGGCRMAFHLIFCFLRVPMESWIALLGAHTHLQAHDGVQQVPALWIHVSPCACGCKEPSEEQEQPSEEQGEFRALLSDTSQSVWEISRCSPV